MSYSLLVIRYPFGVRRNEFWATEVASTLEEKITCSFIYAKFINCLLPTPNLIGLTPLLTPSYNIFRSKFCKDHLIVGNFLNETDHF
jgi:hypothetical protein